MSQNRRARIHKATREEIKSVARQQIAQHGAPALSLRAIAKQMELTAPALYRYYESRDALVTALILDAYRSLAQTLEVASQAHPAQAHANQFLALTLAYRHWALDHAEDYSLIFGTPIPGYVGPMELIIPMAQRCMNSLVTILEAARQAGQLHIPPEYLDMSPNLQADLNAWQQLYPVTPSTAVLHLALVIWGHMHGLILLEIFQHIQPMVKHPAELYRFEMGAIAQRIGLPVEPLG